MVANKFIITRKDLDTDPAVVESEGLTIGRLAGNDLVLNHPTVSRTHAGIKEIEGNYWIFNLSNANGTLLNGELVESTPLADGDLIQIGPFFLRPTYTRDGLALEVEMSVKPLPIDASETTALPGEAGKTVMLAVPPGQREKPTPKGTRRLSGTGLLTGLLPKQDEQALKIFWDKRKREAGKLAAESPLKPQSGRRLGKAQFNWRPTRDLQRAWPAGLFGWSLIIVIALAVVAALVFKDAYSPGALAVAHVRSDLSVTPALANKPNAASCTTCHAVTASMAQSCAACHTTPAFQSSVSDKHTAAGLTCTACHAEHQGRNFRPALVANSVCVSCHRDGVISSGKRLRTPHGGTLGYPVADGAWTRWEGLTQARWQRQGLPGMASQYHLKEQFHLIHVAGRRQGRANCSDCHTAGFEGEAVKAGVRDSCAKCHDVNFEAASAKEAGTGCVSCHAQHGEEKELKASWRRME
jgi:predicted CXXCH cytochrome family protein